MLKDFQGDSWGSILPLQMSSLLPHDLCHGRSASCRPPTIAYCLHVLSIFVHLFSLSLSIWTISLWFVVYSLSHVRLFATPWIITSQAPLSSTISQSLLKWCYITISSPVAPFSFCLQSLPASGSFPVIQLFPSDGQSTEASVSASVLSVNIHG